MAFLLITKPAIRSFYTHCLLMSISIHLRPNYSTADSHMQCYYFEFQSICRENVAQRLCGLRAYTHGRIDIWQLSLHE